MAEKPAVSFKALFGLLLSFFMVWALFGIGSSGLPKMSWADPSAQASQASFSFSLPGTYVSFDFVAASAYHIDATTLSCTDFTSGFASGGTYTISGNTVLPTLKFNKTVSDHVITITPGSDGFYGLDNNSHNSSFFNSTDIIALGGDWSYMYPQTYYTSNGGGVPDGVFYQEFQGCGQLASLGPDFRIASQIDAAVPTSVGSSFCDHMFDGCSALTSFPAGFNLPTFADVTTIGDTFCNYMFNECHALASLPAGFNLPAFAKVGSVGSAFCAGMFCNCYALTALPAGFNLPLFVDTVSADFPSMFSGDTFVLKVSVDNASKRIKDTTLQDCWGNGDNDNPAVPLSIYPDSLTANDGQIWKNLDVTSGANGSYGYLNDTTDTFDPTKLQANAAAFTLILAPSVASAISINYRIDTVGSFSFSVPGTDTSFSFAAASTYRTSGTILTCPDFASGKAYTVNGDGALPQLSFKASAKDHLVTVIPGAEGFYGFDDNGHNNPFFAGTNITSVAGDWSYMYPQTYYTSNGGAMPDWTFSDEFSGCTSLVNPGTDFQIASQIDAADPTAIGMNFCAGMFDGCTALTELPAGFRLPTFANAGTIGGGFCQSMFYGCVKLAKLPTGFTLPAYTRVTSVGLYFCSNMFANCTALTTLPVGFNLPAFTSLVAAGSGFCANIFSGDTLVLKVPVSAAKKIADQTFQCCWGDGANGSAMPLSISAASITAYDNQDWSKLSATSGTSGAYGYFSDPDTFDPAKGQAKAATFTLTLTPDYGSGQSIAVPYQIDTVDAPFSFSVPGNDTSFDFATATTYSVAGAILTCPDFTSNFTSDGAYSIGDNAGLPTLQFNPTAQDHVISVTPGLGGFYGLNGSSSKSLFAGTDITSVAGDWSYMYPQTYYTSNNSGVPDYVFYQEFNACTNLVSLGTDFQITSQIDAAAPMAIGASFCKNMFYGCTALTSLPASFNLPAFADVTTVGKGFCEYMFDGCAALTSLSASFSLPDFTAVTTISDNFCHGMFWSCSQLSSLPAGFSLPAYANVTSVGMTFCGSMFNSCTALTTLPAGFSLPTFASSVYLGNSFCSNIFNRDALVLKVPVSATGTIVDTTFQDCWGNGDSGNPALPLSISKVVANDGQTWSGLSATSGTSGAYSYLSDSTDTFDPIKNQAKAATFTLTLKPAYNNTSRYSASATVTYQIDTTGSFSFSVPSTATVFDFVNTASTYHVSGTILTCPDFASGFGTNGVYTVAADSALPTLKFNSGSSDHVITVTPGSEGFYGLYGDTNNSFFAGTGITALGGDWSYMYPRTYYVSNYGGVSDYTFYQEFQNCTSLASLDADFQIASQIGAAAPTSAGNEFCTSMFAGCTALTALPTGFRLPTFASSTSLYDDFCASMFSGCVKLAELPAGFSLPAYTSVTTVGESFCASMFANCGALTSLPMGFNLPTFASGVSVDTGFCADLFSGDTIVLRVPVSAAGKILDTTFGNCWGNGVDDSAMPLSVGSITANDSQTWSGISAAQGASGAYGYLSSADTFDPAKNQANAATFTLTLTPVYLSASSETVAVTYQIDTTGCFSFNVPGTDTSFDFSGASTYHVKGTVLSCPDFAPRFAPGGSYIINSDGVLPELKFSTSASDHVITVAAGATGFYGLGGSDNNSFFVNTGITALGGDWSYMYPQAYYKSNGGGVPDNAFSHEFSGCNQLGSLDAGFQIASQIDAAAPTSVGASFCDHMFENCSVLATVSAGFNLPAFTDVASVGESFCTFMFVSCSALTALPAGFNLPVFASVTFVGDFFCNGMFCYCGALTALPAGFNLPTFSGGVTLNSSFQRMFDGDTLVMKALVNATGKINDTTFQDCWGNGDSGNLALPLSISSFTAYDGQQTAWGGLSVNQGGSSAYGYLSDTYTFDPTKSQARAATFTLTLTPSYGSEQTIAINYQIDTMSLVTVNLKSYDSAGNTAYSLPTGQYLALSTSSTLSGKQTGAFAGNGAKTKAAFSPAVSSDAYNVFWAASNNSTTVWQKTDLAAIKVADDTPQAVNLVFTSLTMSAGTGIAAVTPSAVTWQPEKTTCSFGATALSGYHAPVCQVTTTDDGKGSLDAGTSTFTFGTINTVVTASATADPSISWTVAGKTDLVYTGAAHDLVSATWADPSLPGTAHYAVTTTDTSALTTAGAATGGRVLATWQTTGAPQETDAGTYRVWYYASAADYLDTTPDYADVTIARKPLTPTWSGVFASYDYTGSGQGPAVSVATGITGETLTVTCTYTGTGSYDSTQKPADVGSYTATVTISDNTSGTDDAKASNYTLTAATDKPLTQSFAIAAVAASMTGTPAATEPTYNGSAQAIFSTSGISATGGTVYYAVSDTKPLASATSTWHTSPADLKQTDAGSYKLWYYVKGDSNHTDSAVVDAALTCKIDPRDISLATIATISDQIYTGSPIKPTPAVTDGVPQAGTVLKAGAQGEAASDFYYSYANNKDTASASATTHPSVIVHGQGNYTGTKDAAFSIVAPYTPPAPAPTPSFQADLSALSASVLNIQRLIYEDPALVQLKLEANASDYDFVAPNYPVDLWRVFDVSYQHALSLCTSGCSDQSVVDAADSALKSSFNGLVQKHTLVAQSGSNVSAFGQDLDMIISGYAQSLSRNIKIAGKTYTLASQPDALGHYLLSDTSGATLGWVAYNPLALTSTQRLAAPGLRSLTAPDGQAMVVTDARSLAGQEPVFTDLILREASPIAGIELYLYPALVNTLPNGEQAASLNFKDIFSSADFSIPVTVARKATVKVSWSAQGGKQIANRVLKLGSKLGSLPKDKRSGHVLKGWYTASKGGVKVSATYPVKADLTLYAHWYTQGKVVKCKKLALYKHKKTHSKTLKRIKKAKKVTILKSYHSWYKVKYGKKTGYVKKHYIDKYPWITKGKVVKTKTLKMHAAQNKSAKVLKRIKKGKVVKIYKSYGRSWYKIKYGKKFGYVQRKYIDKWPF
jgi:uncharacterized repeat protein (TIGR02543 family)